MDDDGPTEALTDLKTRSVGALGVAQIAAGTGLAVYAVWVGILQPGFRRVPLKLQVPYLPASKSQVRNVMALLKGRKGSIVDLGSGDGRVVLEGHRQGFTPAVGYELNPWLVSLSRFKAWRASHQGKVSYKREDLWKLSLLQKKLLTELHDDALVIAGRFPFPDWTPCRTEGLGVDKAWAYSIKAQRHVVGKKAAEDADVVSKLFKEEAAAKSSSAKASVIACAI